MIALKLIMFLFAVAKLWMIEIQNVKFYLNKEKLMLLVYMIWNSLFKNMIQHWSMQVNDVNAGKSLCEQGEIENLN